MEASAVNLEMFLKLVIARKKVWSGLSGQVVLDTSVLSGGVDLLTSHLIARFIRPEWRC